MKWLEPLMTAWGVEVIITNDLAFFYRETAIIVNKRWDDYTQM